MPDPTTPNTPLALPVQPAALSPGEQLVWAAAFAHALAGGCHSRLASRLATRAVQRLRDVEVDLLPEHERAAVEQMRGAR